MEWKVKEIMLKFLKVHFSEEPALLIPEPVVPTPEVKREWSVVGEVGVGGAVVTEVLEGFVFQRLMMAAVL